MAEEKTYVFGEGAGNNGILSLLGSMLSQKGVDPNVLLAMQGRNNDGFGEGGWFIWVIFLFFLMGWGGNGFGNNGAGGLGNQLNNDYGREMLLQAISSVDFHKEMITCFDRILTELNPELAEKQQQQSEINSLKNQVGEMSKSITELMELNRELMLQLKKE